MQRRWYWKAYFFFSASMVVLTIAFFLYPGYETAPSDVVAQWISVPFYIVQLLGLYGFIYWRRFCYERLWQLVFAVTVIEAAWTVYSMSDDLPDLQGFEGGFLAIMAAALTALMVPLLVALFIYAFRSPRLWAQPNRT